MKEIPTKDRILEAAEEMMLERSFHSVGLKQILDTAKVPKGSFYHYFKSKEQFGVEMLRHYMDEVTSVKRQMLLAREIETNPLKRLFLYLEGAIEYFQSTTDKFPCLALKLASEVSDLSTPMREEIERGFKAWITIYQELLDEAKAENMLPESFDSELEAQLIHDLMTGATHRAVINRAPEPVRCAVEHIKSRISGMMG